MISKIIPGAGFITLHKDEIEGWWVLDEGVDAQTYDEYDNAKADYDAVVDSVTLTKVFGWDENPYER